MKSIRSNLTLGVVGVLSLLLLAGGTALYWAIKEAHYDQFDAGLRTQALIVITSTEVNNERVQVAFSDRFLREFDDEVATSFFQVWDDKNRVVERSDSLRRDDLPRERGDIETPAYWNFVLPNGLPGRGIAIGFRPRPDDDDDRNHKRSAVVVVAADRSGLEATLSHMLMLLLLAGGAMLAAMLALVPWVLRRGLAPLNGLTAWADRVNEHTLTERIETTALPPELKPIGTCLNDLLARLGNSFERERRFSSNLAHELLTPVAEIRMLAESALKWSEEAGPESHRKSLEAALRMESLITRLLDLLRAEEGVGHGGEIKPIALRDALAETWRPLVETATRKQLRFDVQAKENLTVEADPVLLRSVMTNLLTNAVLYSPTGTVIVAMAEEDGPRFRLTVTNATDNLSDEDLPHLFEKLWRKDEARADGRSHGLGLSLVAEFIRMLGWEIRPLLSADRALTLEISGPMRR